MHGRVLCVLYDVLPLGAYSSLAFLMGPSSIQQHELSITLSFSWGEQKWGRRGVLDGVGMSWDSVIATAPRERRAVFVRLDTVFLAPLPCWAVLPAIWPSAPLALDFIYGKIQQGQKVNEKPLPVYKQAPNSPCTGLCQVFGSHVSGAV